MSPDSDFQSVIADFIVFSPENNALRALEREGQIEPLGINGEGLLKLLTVMSYSERHRLKKINEYLEILGWFDNLAFYRTKWVILKELISEINTCRAEHYIMT